MSNSQINTATETLEALLSRYFPERLERVLDCAPGSTTRVQAWRARGAAVIAALLDSRAGGDASHYDQAVACDLECELPPLGQHFDFILCHDVLARLRDPEPLLRSLHPLLEPGGMLVVTVPNLQNHTTLLKLVHGEWVAEAEGPLARPHIRFFTGSELYRLLQKTGFHVQRTSALRFDAPEQFPRDSDQIVRMGRVHIGPLNDDEYRQYLVREYAFVATVSA